MNSIARLIILFIKQFTTSFAKILAFGMAFVVIVLLLALTSKETTVPKDEISFEYYQGDQFSADSLLYLPIHGVILTEQATDPLSSLFETQLTYGYEVKDILKKAAEDNSIKGIFLHIDSPGGTVAGAKAIGDGIAAYRQKTGKPVYAYVSGMAASGGYWAASAADKIYADTGTSIGSIGVIFGPFKYYDTVLSEDGGAFVGGVVTENGVETTYITAGRSKDLGNPYRQLTPEELASLQESVEDVYSVFIDQVATTRALTPADIRERIGAMIFSEQQAKARQLIDDIGTRDTTQQALAVKSGLSPDDYKLVTVSLQGSWFSDLMGVRDRWLHPSRVAMPGCPLSRVMMAYHGDVTALCK
jgi:protease IV